MGYLILTIFFGGIFIFVQIFEYAVAPFRINDGIYGRTFYFLTGFHGFHVIIVLLGLLIILFILCRNNLNLIKTLKIIKKIEFIGLHSFFKIRICFYLLTFCRCSLNFCLWICLYLRKYII